MILSAEKTTKNYSEKKLLQNCSLFIDDKDKIGVIGINGTGKSTLLKILAQKELADSGTITTKKGARIGYLSQNPDLNKSNTILEQVLLNVEADEKEAQEYEAKSILNKLGITSFNEKVGNLSGGQKKRIALASTLITPCDILILDEPTNHLDNEMITWLESYLIRFAGAILMVTHDRYFLDRVVTRIVEVSQGDLFFYDGNYSKYLELKALREEMDIATARKRGSLFRKELEWMRRGPRARGTKSKERIERFEQLSDSLTIKQSTTLELSSISTRLGKKIIEINNLSKRFGEKQVLKDFSHIVARDARIGIVGENGSGKSTLLNLISRHLKPDAGEIVLGDTVKIAYFTQESSEVDSSLRVIDYIKSFGESVETIDGRLSASQMLEKFLFTPDLQWNTMDRLSGGERRRLFLLTLVMSAPNILLLDEPTNDLDIDTLMILEDYLESFSGAVLTVSHDRYFLDKVVDLIFNIGVDGYVEKYQGSYSDYLAVSGNIEKNISANNVNKPEMKKKTKNTRNRKIKFSFNEQREYEVIDSQIAELEQQQAELETRVEDSSSDFERLQLLLAEKEEITRRLDEKTERWFYLNEIAEPLKDES